VKTSVPSSNINADNTKLKAVRIFSQQIYNFILLSKHNEVMKLFSLVVATSCLAASAFGVSPVTKSITVTKNSDVTSPLRKDTAVRSPLFRDGEITRGGAFPGWAAYNEALDKNPLPTKALTSLVGWALGDILAQVRKS
jgi:hypothetical protein